MGRTPVILDDDVIEAIDNVVGRGGRSGFLEEAAAEKLGRLELEQAISEGQTISRRSALHAGRPRPRSANEPGPNAVPRLGPDRGSPGSEGCDRHPRPGPEAPAESGPPARGLDLEQLRSDGTNVLTATVRWLRSMGA